MTTAFSPDVLAIDVVSVTEQLATAIADIVTRKLRRKGAVLGLSGGIDSSVAAALCVRALGADRVLGLLMPEADSSPDSTRLGRLAAAGLGIPTILEDIAPILAAAGCYRRRDDAIRAVVPEYDERYELAVLRDADRVLATVVWHRIDDLVYVAEMLAADVESLDDLLVAFLRMQRREGACAVSLILLGDGGFAARLAEYGFFLREVERTMMVYIPRASALAGNLARVDRWALFDGDIL